MAKFSMNFLCLLPLMIFASLDVLCVSSSSSYNVLSFGAKGTGVVDTAPAFLNAWTAACESTEASTIYIPKGRYLLGPVAFGGKCKSPMITFQIDGTLVAPLDYHSLCKAKNWVSFEGVNNVAIIGGWLDAKGPTVWACKATGHCDCPGGATTLSITNSNNIRINGLSSLNSQMFHIVINGCQNVNIERVKILASGDSPNTDGIHVQSSTNVAILGSSIKTGDDCVSIGPGTKNLWIERVTCGPGHGISIGSLAKGMEEEGVQNVTVKQAIFVGTQNGLRIKSWARPSNGFVKRVRFLGATMQNVQNPIVIDQNYCPHNLNCPGQVSGVQISDIIYEGIKGTSATPVAIKFDCSSKYPCKGIRLHDVHLTYLNNKVALSSCSNVIGSVSGLVQPNSCL